jgi:hypothetical protein
MAKIPLTIDKNYCSGWNVWHGIRELLQNAKDAEEYDEHPMEINHYPKTHRLEINTLNVQVNPGALLVLGKTSKGDGRYRGKFGEGFVLGILALVRAGYDVKFRNHEMSWTVAFEEPDPGHPLAGNELLTFQSRQLPAREPDFKVEVHGVSAEIWEELKKLALFIEAPKKSETIETDAGTLLLNPAYKGRVFVRGLFVRTFADLECGYDLASVQLDRDRQMIDEWQLHYQLGKIWNEASAENLEMVARVYEMSKSGASEVKHLHYHADKKLLEKMREQFEQEHGVLAVPVSTSVEAKEVSKVGGKAAVVSSTLKGLLEPTGLSLEAAKKRLEGTVTRRWAPADLQSGPEANEAAYLTSCRLEEILPNVLVVTFAGEIPTCHLIDDNRVIGVDRRLLDQPFKEVLASALGAEAQRVGKTPFDVLLEHVVGKESTAPTDNGDADECDECHHQIPVTERSTVNAWHSNACSLYHPNDVPPEIPF